MKIFLFAALVLFTQVCLAVAADFDIRDETEFKKIVPPDTKLAKVVADMKFTEGPVSEINMQNGFTSTLIPAFSPRRRRIVHRYLGMARAAIDGCAVSYINQTQAVPSPGGEGQGEGERFHHQP